MEGALVLGGLVYVCLYFSFVLEGTTRTMRSLASFGFWRRVLPRARGSDEDNTTPEDEIERKEREGERELGDLRSITL